MRISGNIKRSGADIFRFAAFVLCVLLTAAFILMYSSCSKLLLSQQADQRWRGECEEHFGQVSCFLPSEEKLSLKDIYSVRAAMADAIAAAGFDSADGVARYNDAWSCTGKVNISGGNGKGTVEYLAVGGDFINFHPLKIVSGNAIGPTDLMQDRVMLDTDTAWLLFGGTELSGLTVNIEGRPFVVAGVFSWEEDRFSQKSNIPEAGIVVSYDAFYSMDDKAVSCYECVCAEPYSRFSLLSLKEALKTADAEIIRNSERFSFSALKDCAAELGTRSMRFSTVAYPYWENAARACEDSCMLLLALAAVSAVYPVLFIIVRGTELAIQGYRALTENIIPEAVENTEEKIRKKQRQRYEKTKGRHEK